MQDLMWLAVMSGLVLATFAYARLCDRARKRAAAVTLDLWLAAIAAFGLLIYLVAVLIRPERF